MCIGKITNNNFNNYKRQGGGDAQMLCYRISDPVLAVFFFFLYIHIHASLRVKHQTNNLLNCDIFRRDRYGRGPLSYNIVVRKILIMYRLNSCFDFCHATCTRQCILLKRRGIIVIL